MKKHNSENIHKTEENTGYDKRVGSGDDMGDGETTNTGDVADRLETMGDSETTGESENFGEGVYSSQGAYIIQSSHTHSGRQIGHSKRKKRMKYAGRGTYLSHGRILHHGVRYAHKGRSGVNLGRKAHMAINVVLGAILATLLTTVCLNTISSRLHDSASAESTTEMRTPTTESTMGEGEKWQEGDISYNGKHYHYNSNLETILFMGVDSKGPVATAKDYVSGGQSDAMFLLVVDNDNRQVKIISINRNTVTDVDVYKSDGTFFKTLKYQLCLQHAYGDGKRLSCERTVAAVSKLFYNIPISGYLAMNMDGITVMNDALGGVQVDVLEDLEGYGIKLTKGETVTLKGDAAELYLRSRDLDVFDSASNRLKRQQQYLINLSDKLTAVALSDDEEEQQMALDAYDAVSDYVVSSISFAGLVSEVAGYSFDESEMYTIPGTTKMGLVWEEYDVDEEAFYDLIIDIFYDEVTDEGDSDGNWTGTKGSASSYIEYEDGE